MQNLLLAVELRPAGQLKPTIPQKSQIKNVSKNANKITNNAKKNTFIKRTFTKLIKHRGAH